ncbi:MAG: hypothetical protein LBH84_00940, partial [Prevotellaceae bacterium]|nr:hypothetical protein [Prevotellaceae bacterium]
MMKKSLIFFVTLMLLMVQQTFSQRHYTATEEDFDGSSISYAQSPQGSWVLNTDFYLPSLSGAAVSKSYVGFVPPNVGDTTILRLSTMCDFSAYAHVQLRFSHICKVSPKDIAKIQYRAGGNSQWEDIERAAYKGKASNYTQDKGFNAASYSDWKANDSTIIPT